MQLSHKAHPHQILLCARKQDHNIQDSFFKKPRDMVAGARAINACASRNSDPLCPVRNGDGLLPEWFPARLGQLRNYGRNAVRNTTALLQFYNLSTSGESTTKVERLSKHIGVRQ